MNKWICAVILVAVGVILAVLSVPYLAENLALGIIGIASGIVVSVSAIVPLRGIRRGPAKRP